MSDEPSLLEFPCRFPIKAMGRASEEFEALVTAIILDNASLYPGSVVKVTPSGEGNFLSVTVTIEALSRSQLDRIYQDLTACEKVLMAL